MISSRRLVTVTPTCTCRCTLSSTASRSGTRHFQQWLGALVPAFPVSGDHVEVLATPTDFYNTLKLETKNARRRIVLSSLYLGTGHLEHELVNCIHQAMEASPEMHAHVLLDYARGSRGGTRSSRTMLLPLLSHFSHNVRVSLYHTPNLRGWLRAVLPERYNEVIGLQHMKIYLFDDNVLMSGANLSDSYFTNRQDRYVIFRNSPQLANFFSRLVDTVGSFSFQLDENNNVNMPNDCTTHPFKDNDGGCRFRIEAKEKVECLLKDFQGDSSGTEVNPGNRKWEESDTWVFPLVQMGQLGVDYDHQATQRLLRELPEGSKVKLASGYFNLTDDYVHDVIHHSQATFDILTASPEANGFFGAGGLSGAIPDAYTYILKNFCHLVDKADETERVTVQEYFQAGWTFHAKGLWCLLPGADKPQITLVGSSNFGYRSGYKDLEAQVTVITQNQHLQDQLDQEQRVLYKPTTVVTTETFQEPKRGIPLWVSIVTNLIRNFF